MNNDWRRWMTPNEDVTKQAAWLIVALWGGLCLATWGVAHPAIFPSPLDVLAAFPGLWNNEGLGQELLASFTVNAQGLLLAMALAFPLAYLSRVPAAKPLARGAAYLRFVSPAVFLLVLIYVAPSGHMVKVLMLALGEGVFMVTALNGIVQAVPREALDDARTLRMSEWRVTWYVVIRGTLDQAFDVVRDNAAMGWSMLMMVEGIVRSEGGVGVLILNQEKHANFAETYAIALAIVAVGIGQDYAIGFLKRTVCQWSAR